VNQFRSLFSLPANPPQVIIDGNDPGVDGINNPDGPNYASVRSLSGRGMGGSGGSQRHIDLVIGGRHGAGGRALSSRRARRLWQHCAYREPEFWGLRSAIGTSTNTFLNALWEQAAAQGITGDGLNRGRGFCGMR